MSVFWNKNDTTRQLLFGSSMIEIPSSGGSGINFVTSGSSAIFDVNNDIDCLGDLILEINLTGLSTAANVNSFSSQDLTNIVQRVEIQVGTQIWQTFEHADLLALISTEMADGSFTDSCFQSSGGVNANNYFTGDAPGTTGAPGTPQQGGFSIVGSGAGVTAFLPLKLFTKTLSPRLENFSEQSENGYLMGAAPHQQVKIKITTNKYTAPWAAPNETRVTLKLYGENQVMCNAEREHIKAMPDGMPKRIKMTQNSSQSALSSLSAGTSSMLFDLDHFSLYGSHLILTLPTWIDFSSTNVELLLNSSSFSGVVPLGMLKVTGALMGLYTNTYSIAGKNVGLYNTFVFPLASQCYGGSSVPLNRFDNIRLKFTGLKSAPWITAQATQDYASVLTQGVPNISVTLCGETTALYKGGAASLAMY
jgi:hypothetical protein